MGTMGFPSDAFFQQRSIQIEQGPSPPESVSPAGSPGPSASPPAVPRDEAKAWEAPAVTVLPISATTVSKAGTGSHPRFVWRHTLMRIWSPPLWILSISSAVSTQTPRWLTSPVIAMLAHDRAAAHCLEP
jgi:hypothetical protein